MTKSKDELIIHIMHGYDTIQAPNGDVCFGCYDPKTKEIYVADDIPKEALFHTIAHEYKHYLQDIEGKEFSEEEAEEYADSIFNRDIGVKIDQDKTILEKFIKNVLTRLNELAEDSEYYFDKDNANLVSSVMYECEVALERSKKMKQYCRYRTHLHVNNFPYCDVKNKELKESTCKTSNNCKDYLFADCEPEYQDAFGVTRGYYPRNKHNQKQCDGQLVLQLKE